MPEGPEVTFMVGRLNHILADKYITSIQFHPSSRYGKKTPDNFASLVGKFPLRVIKVANKGKFIYFHLEGDIIIFQTLGMAGGWYNKEHKNLAFTLTYSNSASSDTTTKNNLYMVDPRHFATLKIFLTDGIKQLEKKLASLGPDLVQFFSRTKISSTENDAFYNDFHRIMRKNNSKNICVVLMEQKNFSGIGNYLKSEILDDAAIHPLCTVSQLDDIKLEILYASMKKIITASIKANGTKISSYSDMLMPPEDAIYDFEVYQRKTAKNGDKILKITTPDKRTTFYREITLSC